MRSDRRKTTYKKSGCGRGRAAGQGSGWGRRAISDQEKSRLDWKTDLRLFSDIDTETKDEKYRIRKGILMK